MTKINPRPDFRIEISINGNVCGLDEVGRAPLAGPVVAACVFIPVENINHAVWREVNDSKLIAKKKRQLLFDEIKQHSVFAIAEASPREIEDINILQASFLAMRRAYEGMMINFNSDITCALIDGHITPEFPCPARSVVKGDQKSVSIAAASILAKVYRDRLMIKLADEHPHYGWESNVGYPTKQHREAINRHGITNHHRKSFAPVRNYLEFGNVKAQMKIAI